MEDQRIVELVVDVELGHFVQVDDQVDASGVFEVESEQSWIGDGVELLVVEVA